MAVLTNLFKLDGSPQVIGLGDPYPSMSPGDTVSNIDFRVDPWEPPHRNIKGVTFRGVSVSKVAMERVTFSDCCFEDCLFLGTHFSDVEFHNCKFVDCNLWKARFQRVYLDPETISFAKRFAVEAANVGISTFQALLSNYDEERQDHFFMEVDILFRRWKRYQIGYDQRRNHITAGAAWRSWFASLTYETVAGFGYRPGRFFLWTLAIFVVVSFLNFELLGSSIAVQGSAPTGNLADSLFYSLCVLTLMGFTTLFPVTAAAKALTVFEALFAVGWLAMFTAVLVKRFIR